jgi:methionyl-tRNA formyltransferase
MDTGCSSGGRERGRILFMGTPAFAARILNGLLLEKWNVVGVVTQADKPKGRGRIIVPPPVRTVAEEANLPVFQPARIKDPELIETLQGLDPEVIMVAAYGKILPHEILGLPRLGCFNVHASLLPAYRGAAPIQWSLIRGETRTGITIFRMDAGMDTGDILLTRSIAILPEETAAELRERLASLAIPMVSEALETLLQGKAVFIPQDSSRATYAPVLRKEYGRLDWGLAAEELRNRLRGFDPWPGAYTSWQGRLLKLFCGRAETLEPDLVPGQVAEASSRGLLVRTGVGVLRIEEVQIEGGRRMKVGEFLRGHRMKEGEQLG